jgi:hypothetical protein
MTTAALALNLLLALLLIGALVMGWRVERRLTALRASHAGFTKAVADLDAAAARAEQGLADLRAATDEAAESLADRLTKAKILVAKLDERIDAGEKSAQHTARLAAEAAARRPEAVLELAVRAPSRPPVAPSVEGRVADRVETFRRVLEQPRTSPVHRLRERLEQEDLAAAARPPEAQPTPRSRARIDDDLFDDPRKAGGLGR